MPLSEPAPREKLHTRTLVLEGFRRDDGLYDIEARLADTKTYAFANEDRGEIPPGVPLHGMLMRLTVDEDLTVIACEAETEHSPYAICPAITPNFARLAGLRIGPGWTRTVREVVGGVRGCTHLVELLGPMATVAFQTLAPARRKRAETASATSAGPPPLIDTCHAYAADGPVVARRWPEHARPRDHSAALPARKTGIGTERVPEPDPRE
jgi:hypothetical protein